ncbi:D-amino-acid transaminase [Sediminibacillus massiliensis]|uniref:D-amino-acid transaminase n=1 Tax=Sediminibacillus massiliensis TaxID=1926277 RepID=UPI00098877F2|nr:D-amino-acid transaminase [Sediminibacillus massiliensis]
MKVYPNVLCESGMVDQEKLTYHFQERGLQFGDGIYEVIRVYSGKYYLLEEHIDRMYRSAQAIKLRLPFQKKELYEKLDYLLDVNNIKTDVKVYLQATRGSALRDHVFPDVEANFYAYVQDMPRPEALLSTGVSAITLPDTRWQNCYIKSLNLLPNVLAKQEAKENGAFEAILHRDQTITECSASNVYLVKDNNVYTHPETNQILHGCVRSRIKILAAEANIPFYEEAFTLEQLQNADEVFLTSSTAEVMPIIEIDGKPVNGKTPGKVTRELQKAYQRDAHLIDTPNVQSTSH